MSKSPLNHNPFGSIGKQLRMSKKNNSQANQFQGALGKIKSLAQNDVAQDPLGLLPDQSITSQAANITGSNQSITGQATNIAGSMMRKKSNQGIANSAVSAVAQGTGLNTLTQGPSASSTTEALNAGDYRPMGVSQAFLMKSPLKQNHGGYPSTRTIKERVKAKQTNNPSDRNSSNSNLRKRVKASQNT
jgi:hypothetical protein